MAGQLKHAASLEEIALAEGTTPAAINTLLSRALRKLKRAGLLMTCRELSQILDRGRATEHTVYRRNARKSGAE